MKKDDIYEELLKVSRQLGVTIRHERGYFDGGTCTIKGEDYLVLNKRHTIEKKINILAKEIARFDVDPEQLPEKIRKMIDNERKQTTAVESDDGAPIDVDESGE